MGGGGYVAGPVGLAALSTAHPAGADGGRQPSRPDQPPARAVRAARVPGVRAAGPRRRALPRDRAADTAAGARPRAARARFGIEPDETCVLVFGGSLGARSINLAAVEAFAGAPFHVLHVSGGAITRELARAGELPRGLRPARVPRPAATSPTRSRRPTWWSRARAARCSRSPRTGCRRSSSPTRTPRPTIRARTRAGWRTPARRS